MTMQGVRKISVCFICAMLLSACTQKADEPFEHTGLDRYLVTTAYLDEELASHQSSMRSSGAYFSEPYKGEPPGIRLNEPDDFLLKLGFRSGDIIESIDSKNLIDLLLKQREFSSARELYAAFTRLFFDHCLAPRAPPLKQACRAVVHAALERGYASTQREYSFGPSGAPPHADLRQYLSPRSSSLNLSPQGRLGCGTYRSYCENEPKDEDCAQLKQPAFNNVREAYIGLTDSLTAKCLTDVQYLPNLKRLSLVNGRLRPESARCVAALPLEELNLKDCTIANDDLAELRSSKIKVLHIDSRALDDQGLQHLERLANLQALHLINTATSAEGRRHFSAARPEIKISTVKSSP